MCVWDNKHGSVERSRMVRLREERGQRDNDHSVSVIAYITGHPLSCMSMLHTHTHTEICRSHYGPALPLSLAEWLQWWHTRFKIESKSERSSLCFSGGGSEKETNREKEKVVECQYGLNNRISEIIAVFFRSCWAHSGRVLHNDYSQGGGGGGGGGNSGGCVEVVVKGGVVVTGAEIKPGRRGRQRFNLLRGDFNCYTAN